MTEKNSRVLQKGWRAIHQDHFKDYKKVWLLGKKNIKKSGMTGNFCTVQYKCHAQINKSTYLLIMCFLQPVEF